MTPRPVRPGCPGGPVRPVLLLAAALLALTLPTGCALWHRGPTHKAVDELSAKQQHSTPKQEISTKRTGLHQRTEILPSSYP